MLTYHVYLWEDGAHDEAEVAIVQAPDSEHALLSAMEEFEMTSVSAVWIVSPDDETVDARAENVVLLTFEECDEFLTWCQAAGQEEVLHVE